MGKNREHHEEHIDETWLIPYSDLLTLLLALFIVLFASSSIDVKKFNAMKEAFNIIFDGNKGILQNGVPSNDVIEKIAIERDTYELKELTQLKQEFDQYIAQNNLSDKLETRISGDYLVITIREEVLFDSGSAEIRPEAKEKVSAIANILLDHPECEVVISGHTDNVPIHNKEFETNWDLSSKRALNFMKLLLKDNGLDPKRFSAIGYGEYRPIASNATAEGRAKNRRVEVAIKGGTVSTAER